MMSSRIVLAVAACCATGVTALQPFFANPGNYADLASVVDEATNAVKSGKDLAERKQHPRKGRGFIPKNSNVKRGVRLIKIQKTASSSLGDYIIPMFCPHKTKCYSATHLDWVEATMNGTYTGPVITMLRHPVERAFSEFFYLRDTDGHNSMVQPQWDFHNTTWLEAIQDQNITKAFDAYINGYPKNPSRNRQALYILGFRHGETKEEAMQHAGSVFDWDNHPGSYVTKAMDHLENLTAFGIVECWVSSMSAISRVLGWNETEVVASAMFRHERGWHKMMVERRKPDYWRLKTFLGKDIGDEGKWGEIMPRTMIRAVERWSKVDMMLYESAKQLFVKKFGLPCE